MSALSEIDGGAYTQSDMLWGGNASGNVRSISSARSYQPSNIKPLNQGLRPVSKPNYRSQFLSNTRRTNLPTREGFNRFSSNPNSGQGLKNTISKPVNNSNSINPISGLGNAVNSAASLIASGLSGTAKPFSASGISPELVNPLTAVELSIPILGESPFEGGQDSNVYYGGRIELHDVAYAEAIIVSGTLLGPITELTFERVNNVWRVSMRNAAGSARNSWRFLRSDGTLSNSFSTYTDMGDPEWAVGRAYCTPEGGESIPGPVIGEENERIISPNSPVQNLPITPLVSGSTNPVRLPNGFPLNSPSINPSSNPLSKPRVNPLPSSTPDNPVIEPISPNDTPIENPITKPEIEPGIEPITTPKVPPLESPLTSPQKSPNGFTSPNINGGRLEAPQGLEVPLNIPKQPQQPTNKKQLCLYDSKNISGKCDDIKENCQSIRQTVDDNLKQTYQGSLQFPPCGEGDVTELQSSDQGLPGVDAKLDILGQALQLIWDKVKCETEDPTLVIPEWWQIRTGADRPQLVLFYGVKNDDGSWARARYYFNIPHFDERKRIHLAATLPKKIKKGSYQGILTLADNSKVITYCRNAFEAERVIRAFAQLINKKQLGNEHTDFDLKLGQIKGAKGTKFKEITVELMEARYFATGQKQLTPNWKEKFY